MSKALDLNVNPEDMPRLSDCPPQIRARHLGKLAIVYARQSSADQVREHTGSTADQRALADLPRQWGWSPERILMIDEDLGLSATSSQDRRGFQRMLELLDRDEVGLILVRDVSRISRDPLDSEQFLKRAMEAGVLLHANGQLFDLETDDVTQLFGLRIQQLLGWYDNRNRARMMRDARVAKAKQGHAVSRPPIGYVKSVRGKWIKDPDPRVQEAVGRLFTLYRAVGSIGNVVNYLRNHGLLFPLRRHGEIRWAPIARSTVENIFKNPNYTDRYVYQRQKVSAPRKHRRARFEFRSPAEWITIPAHHEPYVTHEDWQAIQTALTSRRPTVRPPVCRGPALLQGLMWCVRCERFMWTHYGRRDGTGLRWASYVCRLPDRSGNVSHVLSCAARFVDEHLVRRVLTALGPVEIDAALAAIDEHRAERGSLTEAHARMLQQAEDDVARTRRSYELVDHKHALVKADLEAELEQALARRDALKRQIATAAVAAPVTLNPTDAHELVNLSKNVTQLWAAATTTNEDRKRLLQTVITRVLVHDVTDDAVELQILWVGGLVERVSIPRGKNVDEIVRALWQAGKDARQIAAELRMQGLTNRLGRPIPTIEIRRRVTELGLTGKRDKQAVMDLITQYRAAGRIFQANATALNAAGYRPQRLRTFTAHQVEMLLAGWKHRQARSRPANRGSRVAHGVGTRSE
jgi:DNA invertase Pin-like site-specific DNA recombinase